MSIYLKAAALIVEGKHWYCCNALRELLLDRNANLTNFKYYFKPVNRDYIWWDDTRKYENQLARSLGLLLMHEIELTERKVKKGTKLLRAKR